MDSTKSPTMRINSSEPIQTGLYSNSCCQIEYPTGDGANRSHLITNDAYSSVVSRDGGKPLADSSVLRPSGVVAGGYSSVLLPPPPSEQGFFGVDQSDWMMSRPIDDESSLRHADGATVSFAEFSGHHQGHYHHHHHHVTTRRKRKSTPTQRVAANIRERRRMCSLNAAFDRLRRRVPAFPHEKKLSRIQTLRLAIKYIQFMLEMVAAAASYRIDSSSTAVGDVASSSSSLSLLAPVSVVDADALMWSGYGLGTANFLMSGLPCVPDIVSEYFN